MTHILHIDGNGGGTPFSTDADVEDVDVILTGYDESSVSKAKDHSSCCSCCCEPCLASCLKPKLSGEYCVTPMFYIFTVVFYISLVLLINFLCPQATVSPLYGHTLSLPAVPIFISMLLLFALVLFVREVRGHAKGDRRSVATRFGKKATVFLLIYSLILPMAYWSANTSLYHDGEEVPDGAGTEFTFTASSNTELLAYNKTYYSFSAASAPTNSITHYPVVFLGGTGVNMYANIHRVSYFLDPTLTTTDDAIAFDVFTFSYRGYVPNDSHTPNERNIIDDSIALYDYVKSLYPAETRPLLFSHSLGTGPASALLEKFGDSDESGPACAGLAMPYSSMSQCISELGFYTPLLFLYLIDSWNSLQRIKNMNPGVNLIILSAALDELIAPHHQQIIFDNAGANDKKLFYSEEADHNDLYSPINLHLEAHLEFMESCRSRSV